MSMSSVQSSRRERVCENSLKAELSTGRTHLPTAIEHLEIENLILLETAVAGEFRPYFLE